MPLNNGLAEQRDELEVMTERFLSTGFLVIPDVLSAEEIEKYSTILDRLDGEVETSSNGVDRVPGDPLEVRNLIGAAPETIGLATHERVLMQVCSIMGYNLQVHTSHAFIRPPFPAGTAVEEQRGLGWHYDMPGCAGPVNGRFPWLYTRVGFFLTDLTEPNAGSLKLVPGSHRVAARPAAPTASGEPFGAVEVQARAGSVLVMDQRLWHATVPNYSQLRRMNIYIGYSWRWIRPMDYRAYPAEILAGQDPSTRQLLGEAATQLGYVFPKDADVPLREWCADRGLASLPKVRMD